MSMARHPRIFLAVLATFASLAVWGLGPIAARSPETASDARVAGLQAACAQALRARLPSRERLKLAPSMPRIESFGGGGYRLVSSFDAGSGRTSYACDATEHDGAYEVAALTLVQW
jgi:hypothetical protein